jgi:hypothetical protein
MGRATGHGGPSWQHPHRPAFRSVRSGVPAQPTVWALGVSLPFAMRTNEGMATMPETTETTETTEPDEGTLEAQRKETGRLPPPDRPPTPQEESDAERQRLGLDAAGRKSVAEHYRQMAELGAQASGEDEIT